MLIAMFPSYVNDCEKSSGKCKCCPHQRLKDRSNTMIKGLMPFHWRKADLVLAIADMSTRERGKWRASGRRNCMKWNDQDVEWSAPSYLVKNQWTQMLAWVVHWRLTFSQCSCSRGLPFVWLSNLSRPTSSPQHPRVIHSREEWDWGSTTECKLPAMLTHWQTARGSSSLDEQEALCYPSDIFWSIPVGSRMTQFNVEGLGVSGSQHWCSDGRGTDHTSEANRIQLAMISSTPQLSLFWG